jgi:hypothetical protein
VRPSELAFEPLIFKAVVATAMTVAGPINTRIGILGQNGQNLKEMNQWQIIRQSNLN